MPLSLFALAAAWCSVATAAPVTWKVDSSHSEVSFAVRHMMIADVRGTFTGVEGTIVVDAADPSKSKAQIDVDAASVDTRNVKRDRHLRSADFFDTEKYPAITFRSKSVQAVADRRFRLTGDLTLRGVTREVVFEVEGPSGEARDPGGTVKVAATAHAVIHRKEFGLTWNMPLEDGGVLLGDDVRIEIAIEADRL